VLVKQSPVKMFLSLIR